MKGDFTRSTFKKKKHFHDVRMQQGRVQLDADWNEQLDITGHRVETETKDVVGLCGTPIHHGGFHIVTTPADLTAEEQALPENQEPPPLQTGPFYISGGRIYVDGILCENEHIVPFTKQPDLPENAEVVTPPSAGTYLAYLDVWLRHITALEDDQIREKALGGPDTATRTKTVWQVKLFQVSDPANCLSVLPDWRDFVKPMTGTLAARAEEAEDEEKPCVLSPEGGYRRLENQLYRVEIHRSGELPNEITFKWSRDNGTVVAKWEKQGQGADENKLTVSSTGRDEVLNFKKGHWVELTDDTRELLGKPGILVLLADVEGLVLTIDTDNIIDPDNSSATSVDIDDFDNPKVRRWDSPSGEVSVDTSGEEIELEDGVMVKFSDGSYKTGDYWLIPARTVDADVEWPKDDSPDPQPIFQPPHGIHHHYCPLALLTFDGTSWEVISDCRSKFPPVTELTSLYYVSGDGQEAMPGNTLPNDLQVRVANGQIPVIDATVRFTVLSGSGSLSSGASAVSITPDDGIAGCSWTLGPDGSGSQQVSAVLLDAAGDPVPGQIVYFNANLSVAENVYYDPKGCVSLSSVDNVQDVLEKLSKLRTISYVGGDGQDAVPGEWLPKPLEVRVVSKCGPVAGAKVIFTAESGGLVAGDMSSVSTATGTVEVNTDPDGKAGCVWLPDLDKPVQELTAVLDEASTDLVQEPKSLRFTANLKLRGGDGCCTVTVGDDGDYNDIQAAVDALGSGPGTVCILPGIYVINKPIDIVNGWGITITGCKGKSIILNVGKNFVFEIKNTKGINIENLWLISIFGASAVSLSDCWNIHISDCTMAAFKLAENIGVITLQGQIIGCTIEKSIAAGFNGIRFNQDVNTIPHVNINIRKNLIFALDSAISQDAGSMIIGFDVVENFLTGFSVSSLLFTIFNTTFLEYALERSMYDETSRDVIRAELNKLTPSTTWTNTQYISYTMGFVNNLSIQVKSIDYTRKDPPDKKIDTTSAVIDLQTAVLKAAFYKNTLIGRTAMHLVYINESSIKENAFLTYQNSILLGSFDGITIAGNFLCAGQSCIQFGGSYTFRLTVSNNSFWAGSYGIKFSPGNVEQVVHRVKNFQIDRNHIHVTNTGIEIEKNEGVLILKDFSIIDNTIRRVEKCGIRLNGIDEVLDDGNTPAQLQRVIQNNSIYTAGKGISVDFSGVKILDNDIRVESRSSDSSFGIEIFDENCTAANNNITAVVNPNINWLSRGGILIDIPIDWDDDANVMINSNRITGGTGNGIQIDCNLYKGIINGNIIDNMSLNGIAVGPGVIVNTNLTISNNKITGCNHYNGVQTGWWRNAGIVLNRGVVVRVEGNEIIYCGKQTSKPGIFVGGFYAFKLRHSTIESNYFIGNGHSNPTPENYKAIICIPSTWGNLRTMNVRITNNLVKDSRQTALLLGTRYYLSKIPNSDKEKNRAYARRNIITDNHFESLQFQPVVSIQSSESIFSNNNIKGEPNPDGIFLPNVNLGFGWDMTVIGNVEEGGIHGEGYKQMIRHNISVTPDI